MLRARLGRGIFGEHWHLLSGERLRTLELTKFDLAPDKVRASAEALIFIGELFDLDIADASVMVCPKSHTFDRARRMDTGVDVASVKRTYSAEMPDWQFAITSGNIRS